MQSVKNAPERMRLARVEVTNEKVLWDANAGWVRP